MAKTSVLVQLFVIASLTQDSIAVHLRRAGDPDTETVQSVLVPPGMHGKNCADKAAFHDEKGNDCTSWAGVWDCSEAMANHGYSAAGQQNLIDHCPGACRVCVTTLDGQFLYPTKDEEQNWLGWWKTGAAVSMDKMWVTGYGPEDEAKKTIARDKAKEEAEQKAQEAKALQEAAAAKAAEEKKEAAAKKAMEKAAAEKAAAAKAAEEKKEAAAKKAVEKAAAQKAAAKKAAAEKAAEEKKAAAEKAAQKKEAEEKAAKKKKAQEAEAAEKKAAGEKAAAEKAIAEKKAKEAAAKKTEEKKEDKPWWNMWR